MSRGRSYKDPGTVRLRKDSVIPISPRVTVSSAAFRCSSRMVVQFKVFKKAAPNGKLTIYLGRRDFVDHVSAVDPVGKSLESSYAFS